MMERVTEPELMDEEEQVKAYAFAHFSEPHDLLIQASMMLFSI